MSHVITITGNAGKTTFAYYLAMAYQKRGQKVALVSTDGQKPMFRLLVPTKKPAPNHSLGRLLSLAVITKTELFDNAQVLDDNLLMFSYTDGDSILSYPEITGVNLRNFHDRLSAQVDVILVDTSTARNDIDRYFMNVSTEICITTADARGVAYRDYYRPQAIQLALPTSPYNALADVMGTYAEPAILLPYCKVLAALYNGMDITDISLPKKYRKAVESVVKLLDSKLQPQGE
jgi:hypothetical protein